MRSTDADREEKDEGGGEDKAEEAVRLNQP